MDCKPQEGSVDSMFAAHNVQNQFRRSVAEAIGLRSGVRAAWTGCGAVERSFFGRAAERWVLIFAGFSVDSMDGLRSGGAFSAHCSVRTAWMARSSLLAVDEGCAL